VHAICFHCIHFHVLVPVKALQVLEFISIVVVLNVAFIFVLLQWELVVSSGKSPRLACATANGSLVFLTLNEHWRREASISGSNGSSSGSSASDSGSIGSPFRFEGVSEPAGHLFLSLDWNNRSPLFHRALSPKVAVGEALGCVSMWHANSGSSMAEISGVGAGNADSSDGKDRCDSGSSGDSGSTIRSGYRGDGGNAEVGAPVLERRWLAHTLCGEPSEVWSVAFDPSAPHTLLASGADDACLKLWDLRAASGTSSSTSSTSSTSTSSTSNSSSTSSTDSSRRSSNGVFGCAPGLAACVAGAHNAGVTSLAFAPSERWPHVLASGSYDGTVSIVGLVLENFVNSWPKKTESIQLLDKSFSHLYFSRLFLTV